MALYKLAPQGVRGCVPTDPPTRKKLIWRTLVERMDQIDGKPSRKQLQVGGHLVPALCTVCSGWRPSCARTVYSVYLCMSEGFCAF